MTTPRHLSTSIIADLVHIAQHGGSVPAADLPTTTRTTLVDNGWITTHYHDGSPSSPDDWAGTIRLTTTGQQAAQTAQTTDPVLRRTDAYPLVIIEGTPDGHAGFWPGTFGALRVARGFALVEQAGRSDSQFGVWTLTTAGRRALQAWRHREPAPPAPSFISWQAMDALAAGRPVRRGRTALWTPQLYGWVSPDGRTVTPAGRLMLAAGPDTGATAPQRRSRHHSVRIADLRRGQLCRMAHRRGWRGLGPEWVVFVRAQMVPRPGGWWVYVESDDGSDGSERRYTDAPIPYQQKFQVRSTPLTAA